MKGPVFRAAGHLLLHCQMGEKAAHMLGREVFRVLLAMKKDVPFDPVEICLLSPQAEMSKASHIAHLFEKFGFRHGEALCRQPRTYHRL